MKTNRIPRALLFALLVILIQTTGSAQDPNFHIYLCFGQSNMEGQGSIEDIDRDVDARFQVLQSLDCSNLGRTSQNWYTAVPPLCQCYSKLGPADYFGRTMVANLPDSIRVGVIVVAVGGCDIRLFDKDIYEDYDSTYSESWFTSKVEAYGGNPYAHLMELAQVAQQDGVIKGILLHQGETNTNDAQWPTYVSKIYGDMLTDLGLEADSVPLLAGEVVQGEGACCASMNNIIATLPTAIPTAHVISSQGCTMQDNAHFDAAGYRKLGFRYSQKMLSLRGIEVKEPQTPPSCVITQPHNNAYFRKGKDIPIRVYASDMGGSQTDGQVDRVEFYVDGELIGTADSHDDQTFFFSWSGADTGTYRITAKAIDNEAMEFMSAGVLIEVDSAFFLSPGLSAGKGKYIGNVSKSTLRSDFNDYWNAVTAENGCKWGTIEGTRDVMNWTQADLGYHHAVEHHLVFRYHVLAWGSQYPKWIETLEATEFQEEMEEYIAAAAERFPLADQVEVLNENMAINTWNGEEHAAGTPYFREGLGGAGETGYDWAIWLFKKARHYFPNAKLVINDFEMETNQAGRNEILDLVKVLRDSGLIDGIGTQAHHFNVDNASSTAIRNALDHVATSGVPVYVTELDLKGKAMTEASQLASYKNAFPAYWNHSAVAGITLWGYVEGQMWSAEAYLLNSDGSERKAMTWLKEYLEGRPDVGYPFDGVPPARDPFQTMILNGEFEHHSYGWELAGLEGAEGSMEVVLDSELSGVESLQICPANPGTDVSHIQLSQDAPLEAGKHYLVSFLAKAEAARELTVAMQRDRSPFTFYMEESLALGTEKQAFSFIFEAAVTDPTTKLKFFAGADPACVRIDSVVCRQVDVSKLEVIQGGTGISLYPNPSHSGTFFLSGTSLAGVIEVYDLNGKQVGRFEQHAPGQSLDLSYLQKGLYFLRVKNQGQWAQAKIVLL